MKKKRDRRREEQRFGAKVSHITIAGNIKYILHTNILKKQRLS